MIIVIADDITGAAEIAGIALRHGVKTVLTTKMALPENGTEALVIATDTRSGNESEAITTVKSIAENIRDVENCVVFKKTDSVLRGHVAAELGAIMGTLNLDNTLLLPQNPSKGRVIRNGRYYINGTPLDETDFNRDPEFPAHSSNVANLTGGKGAELKLSEPLRQEKAICVANAENEDEIEKQLDKATDKTLLAGGADLFTALLRHKYQKGGSIFERGKMQIPRSAIILCGSTQSKPITEEPFIKAIKAREEIMPYDVFRGESAEEWIRTLINQYETHGSLIVGIGDKENGGKDCAVRLRSIMAEATSRLVTQRKPDLIIIEGGATAYAILRSIGWDCFKLKNEYGPGIVSMTYDTTEIVLKPGSYPWGDLFKK